MAVTVVSCYFLPFLFFFFAHIAYPKSIIAFVLAIAALSISSLILYYKILERKNVSEGELTLNESFKPFSVEKTAISSGPESSITAPSSPKITIASNSSNSTILVCAKKALSSKADRLIAHTQAIKTQASIQAQASQQALEASNALMQANVALQATILEQQQAQASQNNLFTEELEKRNFALAQLKENFDKLQQALAAKDLENKRQAKELEDLKFELYTLLRIESYVSSKAEAGSNKLAAASF